MPRHPRKKLVMTRPVKVPGYGKLPLREVRKEDLMEFWEEVVDRAGLEVLCDETVERIERAVDTGAVEVLWKSNARKIEPGAVLLEREKREMEIPADQVFIFAGGVLPTPFLRKCGIEIETKFGAP